MGHFVAYHNTDHRGEDSGPLNVLTKKRLALNIEGKTIWLVAGEGGTPKRYTLLGKFTAGTARATNEDEFEFEIPSFPGQGHRFSPPIPLNDQHWFPDFLKSQGNFGFGLNEINDPIVIEGLETLARVRY